MVRRDFIRRVISGTIGLISLPRARGVAPPSAPTGSAAAISIPFGKLPTSKVIYGPIYRITIPKLPYELDENGRVEGSVVTVTEQDPNR